MMLEVKNLSILRNERTIVESINFNITYGEVLWVSGSNGAGKTTLLKVLAGIYKNYEGSIIYNSFDIKDHKDEYQELLSYQPDKPVADESLTIFDNLRIWAELYDRLITLPAVIHSLGFQDLQHAKSYTLSKGQMQRLHLGKLLLKDSELWLLDEPTAHIDNDWKNYLIKLINMHTSNGGIVIYTSQDSLLLPNEKKLEL